jgi:hypothetical protein
MNKTKNTKKVKLSLDRQALRLLTSDRLGSVVGGRKANENDTCDMGHTCGVPPSGCNC